MKANELRIGNYFTDKEGNILTCLGVASGVEYQEPDVVWYGDELGFYEHVEDCKPILLTEQWFLDFGMQKDESQETFYFPIGVNIRVGKDAWQDQFHSYNIKDKTFGGLYCEYVHQLQNLYYALTGKELAKS